MRGDAAVQNHGSMLICGTAVAIVVGTVLLLLLSRLIGRVQFSLGTAFWCSFIGHIFGMIVGLFMGFLFAYHMAIGLLIAFAISWAFQTVVFQIFVRAKSGTLQQWRAAILSVVVILGDFLVASPLIALWEHYRTVGSPPVAATPADEAMKRGKAAESESDWDLAITEYTNAIRLNPKCAEADCYRSGVYAAKHDWDRTLADLPKPSASNPLTRKRTTAGASSIRKANAGQGHPPDCNEAIRLKPEFAGDYLSRGLAYCFDATPTGTKVFRTLAKPSASTPVLQRRTTFAAVSMQPSMTGTRRLRIVAKLFTSTRRSPRPTTSAVLRTTRRVKTVRRKQTLRRPRDSDSNHVRTLLRPSPATRGGTPRHVRCRKWTMKRRRTIPPCVLQRWWWFWCSTGTGSLRLSRRLQGAMQMNTAEVLAIVVLGYIVLATVAGAVRQIVPKLRHLFNVLMRSVEGIQWPRRESQRWSAVRRILAFFDALLLRAVGGRDNVILYRFRKSWRAWCLQFCSWSG